MVLSTLQSYIQMIRKLINCFCLMLALISRICSTLRKATRKDNKRLSDPTATLKCHLVSPRDSNNVTVHWLWKAGEKMFNRLYEKRLHKFTYLLCCFVLLFYKSECIAVKSIAFSHLHKQIFLLCTWMHFCSLPLNVRIALKSVLLHGLAYIPVIFFSEEVALFSKLSLGGCFFFHSKFYTTKRV